MFFLLHIFPGIMVGNVKSREEGRAEVGEENREQELGAGAGACE